MNHGVVAVSCWGHAGAAHGAMCSRSVNAAAAHVIIGYLFADEYPCGVSMCVCGGGGGGVEGFVPDSCQRLPSTERIAVMHRGRGRSCDSQSMVRGRVRLWR